MIYKDRTAFVYRATNIIDNHRFQSANFMVTVMNAISDSGAVTVLFLQHLLAHAAAKL